MEESEVQSLQHISPCELYPKAQTVTQEEGLTVPFTPLCGEYVAFLGRTTTGILALSNYRLYHQIPEHNTCHNIPLGLVEQVEVRDILYVQISCKDATLCRLAFSTSEECMEWMRRLLKATSPIKNMDYLFAFALYAWAQEEGSEELLSRLSNTTTVDFFNSEVERLQFDVSKGGPWRVSLANKDYRLCGSYPQRLLVPAGIPDQQLDAASKFRSSRRVPAVVWRHRGNGAVIARCSQPEVGWLGWRSSDDEALINAILNACSPDPEKRKKLLIMATAVV
uniref:Myotubularin phosphatase domain-containing protein n=1 Tax=Graphocephala atropunctata TaxID=36148 RepID=A0A1B6M8J2_9HEMI